MIFDLPPLNYAAVFYFLFGQVSMLAICMFFMSKIARDGDFIIASLEEENDELRAVVTDFENHTCERCGSAHCRRDARRKGMKRSSLFGSRRYSSASRRAPVAHKSRWSY